MWFGSMNFYLKLNVSGRYADKQPLDMTSPGRSLPVGGGSTTPPPGPTGMLKRKILHHVQARGGRDKF